MTASWGNSSSVHRAGRKARAVLEAARETLSSGIGCHARDLIFTSGGTESNNQVLLEGAAVITSRLEHPSITACAEYQAARGAPVFWFGAQPSGELDLESLEKALRAAPTGAIVATSPVNHETGVLQPIREVYKLAKSHSARLHLDAVQWLGKSDLTLLELADSISIAAHKIRGPKGIGALIVRGGVPTARLLGGGQERGLRAGSSNVALAHGFALALQHALAETSAWLRVQPLRDELEKTARNYGQINGTSARLAHVSNVSFDNWDGAELVAALDLAGICVSSGSACSAGTTEPSPVIETMLGRDRAKRSVRFSLGPQSTRAEIEQTCGTLRRLLEA